VFSESDSESYEDEDGEETVKSHDSKEDRKDQDIYSRANTL